MTRYNPENPVGFEGRFIRTGDDLWQGDEGMSHDKIAVRDRILDLIDRLGSDTPLEVDAGFFDVEEECLTVRGISVTLDLPICKEARDKTIEVFRRQTPSLPIEAEMLSDIPNC